jgi:hypothetical protein
MGPFRRAIAPNVTLPRMGRRWYASPCLLLLGYEPGEACSDSLTTWVLVHPTTNVRGLPDIPPELFDFVKFADGAIAGVVGKAISDRRKASTEKAVAARGLAACAVPMLTELERATRNLEHALLGDLQAIVSFFSADRYASDGDDVGVELNEDELSVTPVIRRLLDDLNERGVL